MYPFIISPHKFGLKNDMDKVFMPLMLHALKESNPGADIYLPTENEFYLSIPGVNELKFNPSDIDGLQELRSSYKHLSTNHANFELACIERFFILRHFAKALDLNAFFTVESDVLVFEDLNRFIGLISSDSTHIPLLTAEKCISTAFVTIDFLNNFCDGVLNAYGNPNVFSDMEAWYKRYIDSGKKGGVCDMTFCLAIKTGWLGFKKLVIQDICLIYQDGPNARAFDNFFSANYLGDVKSLSLDSSIFDGYPHKRHHFDRDGIYIELDSGRKIYLSSAHFQGNNKKIMSLVYAKYRASKIG